MRRFALRPTDFTYRVMEVTEEGRVRSISITRGEVLASTALRKRDLRSVALQGLPGQDVGPMLVSRKGVLLLGLGELRAIVEPHRALLFGSESRDRSRFLRVFANQRKSTPEGGFSMLFVESALLAHNRLLDARLMDVRRITEPVLQAPPVLREPDLEEVRQRRRLLARCSSQASAVSAALLARLDTEGVEALLDVQSSTQAAEAVEEWEAMLEVYLRSYSELSRECSRMLSDIEDFESSAILALQARRLYLEQFELTLVIASVSISASNLLPGAMGMNVPNGLESSDSAFRGAVTLTLLVCGSLFFLLRGIAARLGFFS